MPPDRVEKQVEEYSKLWHKHRAELARIKEEWRGREADYLKFAIFNMGCQIKGCRQVLIRWVGWDIVAEKYVPCEPREPFTPFQVDFLLNIERNASDLLMIVKVIKSTVQAARENKEDPTLESYEIFFWAMNTIPAAGTLFLMMDSQGDLQEETNLLMAGWMEQHLSLWGQHATRLRNGLEKTEQSLRQQLRQELPMAVLEAAQEWQPGQELLVGEPRKPQPGKKTAGRGPRNFLSRVARIIDCQGSPAAAAFEEDTLSGGYSLEDGTQEGSMSEDTQRMATNQNPLNLEPSYSQLSSSVDYASDLRREWSALMAKAKLKGHTLRMAEFLRDNPDCLKPGANGKIMLERGALQTMSRVLGRPVNLLKQDRLRMALKMEAALGPNKPAQQ